MASKVWSDVYGIPGGTDLRVRVRTGDTDEGAGNKGTHILQVTDACPKSLDMDGLSALADEKPNLQIEFRSVITDANGERTGNDARVRAVGQNAKTRIANLMRCLTESAPAEENEVESERNEAPTNGRLQPA